MTCAIRRCSGARARAPLPSPARRHRSSSRPGRTRRHNRRRRRARARPLHLDHVERPGVQAPRRRRRPGRARARPRRRRRPGRARARPRRRRRPVGLELAGTTAAELALDRSTSTTSSVQAPRRPIAAADLVGLELARAAAADLAADRRRDRAELAGTAIVAAELALAFCSTAPPRPRRASRRPGARCRSAPPRRRSPPRSCYPACSWSSLSSAAPRPELAADLRARRPPR